jgi:Zn-dependent protease
VLLGLAYMRGYGWVALPIFVVAMTLSILVHELGHALAFRANGLASSITLHAMGGVTSPAGDVRGRRSRVLVSLAGPAAGLVFGGLVFGITRAMQVVPPRLPQVAELALSMLLWINVAWSLFNLVPVLPFDGGQVMQEVLGPRRMRTTAAISGVVAALLAAYFALQGNLLMAFIFVASAIQSYQLYNLPPGAVLVNPLTQPMGPGGAGGGGPSRLRRWWLERKLRGLKAEAASLRDEKKPKRREGGPELRVIRGGADEPKDKRYLN